MKEEGNPLLILDAGDMLFSAIPLAPEALPLEKKKAEFIIATQKTIGIDAVALGDQDLAAGLKFVESAYEGGFPFVCANITDAKGRPTKIPGYKIFTVGSIKVGVFGILLSDRATTASWVNEKEFKLTDQVAAGRDMVQTLKDQGVDFIIALTNIGVGNSKIFASEVPGIQLIIAGHDEVMLDSPERVGDTLITTAMKKGQYLGIARIVYLPGQPVLMDAEEINAARNKLSALDIQRKIFTGAIANDPETREKLTEISTEMTEAAKEAEKFIEPRSRMTNVVQPLSTAVKNDPAIEELVTTFKNENNLPPPGH